MSILHFTANAYRSMSELADRHPAITLTALGVTALGASVAIAYGMADHLVDQSQYEPMLDPNVKNS